MDYIGGFGSGLGCGADLGPHYPREKKDPFFLNIRNPIPKK